MSGKVLVAGIGNLFLGDDAFGCEVLRLLSMHPLPQGVRARDFGTRALDLAYELTGGWDAAIFVDAAARGGAPGTLYVIEPRPASDALPVDGHSVRLEQVLAMAAGIGELPPVLRLVGCEPLRLEPDEDGDDRLSIPVQAALLPAMARVHALAAELAGDLDA